MVSVVVGLGQAHFGVTLPVNIKTCNETELPGESMGEFAH